MVLVINTVLDSELLQGFNIFRQDRIGKIDGGVLIAVKEGLQVTRRDDLEIDGVELLVVQLNKANIKPIILNVYYRPPCSSSVDLTLLNNSLLSNPESNCIVLFGDFNIPSISWSNNDLTPIKFTRAKFVRRINYDYNHTDIPALRRAFAETSLDFDLTDSIDDCRKQWKDNFLSVVNNLFQLNRYKTPTPLPGSMVKFATLFARNTLRYENTGKTKQRSVNSNYVLCVSKSNI